MTEPTGVGAQTDLPKDLHGDLHGDLDDWFRAAQDMPMTADGAFLSHIAAEGERIAAARTAPPLSSRRRRVVRGLGGWRGLAGLGAAAIAGLWIGFALPETASVITLSQTSGDETLDLMALATILFDGG